MQLQACLPDTPGLMQDKLTQETRTRPTCSGGSLRLLTFDFQITTTSVGLHDKGLVRRKSLGTVCRNSRSLRQVETPREHYTRGWVGILTCQGYSSFPHCCFPDGRRSTCDIKISNDRPQTTFWEIWLDQVGHDQSPQI